jgi:phosphatidylethanolamine N-methyltransferase
VVKRATEEAFGNWQVGYNISLVMTYGELLYALQHRVCS